MASELRVNTLKDAAGSNEVAMTYVAGGSAKAWHNGNAAGTSLLDSLNVSSIGDTNTGTQTVNLTSNMGNAQYQASSCVMENSTLLPRVYSISTGSYVSAIRNTSATLTDAAQATAIHGDLA